MNKELVEVLRSGDTKKLEVLITSRRIDIKQKDEDGNTALLYAVAYGQIAMVEHLLAKGYSQKGEKNNHGDNILFMAACNGRIAMVEHLLTKGHSHSERNSRGVTIPFMAATIGDIAMVDHFLAKGYAKIDERNNYGNTMFLTAAFCGQTSMLAYLLEELEVSLKERCSRHGLCALAQAAEGDKVAAVSFLLKKGAYIDMLSNCGRSPRQQIEQRVHASKTSLPLLRAAEDLLDLAEGKQVNESKESLLATLGEGLNARKLSGGNTALHLALVYKKMDLVKSLLEHGADVDMPNDAQVTPLQIILDTDNPDPGVVVLAQMNHLNKIVENFKIKENLQKLRKSALSIVTNEEAYDAEEVTFHIDDEAVETISETKASLETKTALESKTSEVKIQQDIATTTFFQQYKDCILSIEKLLGLLPKSAQEKCHFKVGKWLSTLSNLPDGCKFMLVDAYHLLSQISDRHSAHFQDAQVIMAELLISRNVVLQQEGIDSIVTPTTPIISSDTSSLSLENTEDEENFALHLRAIIEHLLNAKEKSIHAIALEGYIAQYALGDENSIKEIAELRKRLDGSNNSGRLADDKSSDIELQLNVIDKLRITQKALKAKEKVLQATTAALQTKDTALQDEKLKNKTLLEKLAKLEEALKFAEVDCVADVHAQTQVLSQASSQPFAMPMLSQFAAGARTKECSLLGAGTGTVTSEAARREAEKKTEAESAAAAVVAAMALESAQRIATNLNNTNL